MFFGGFALAQESPGSQLIDPTLEDPFAPPEGVDLTIPDRILEAIENSDGEKWSPEEARNCFDYYTFQSVQVSVGADNDVYTTGDTIRFSGEIINKNANPVFDGNVFARVRKLNDNYITEGHHVIDEFIALEGVALAENDSIDVAFEWRAPENATGGQYKVDFYFSVGKKFNLGGLPFTNEVIISSAPFSIKNEQDSGEIIFDRSKTMVNESAYNHIGEWPYVDPAGIVNIVQPLLNTGGEAKEVNVTYELYFWDSLIEEDLIQSSSEVVMVSANSSEDLEYTISEMNDSVYYLKITAEAEGRKSIVNIRMTSDQEHPRLNYPGLTKFPLVAGDSATLFTCFHNSSNALAEGVVDVVAIDDVGKEIATTTYEGIIAPSMMVIARDFVSDKDYEYIKIVARILGENGRVIDSYEVEYNCEDIGKCKPTETAEDSRRGMAFVWIGSGLLLLFGILLIFSQVIGKKEKENQIDQKTLVDNYDSHENDT